jgi:hypothetical protein
MTSNKLFLVIALVITTIAFYSCHLEDSVYSKDNHLKTTKIRDSLYSEVFFIRSILNENVERYSEYITDSVNFRKYVYTYNRGEWIYGEMSKDYNILTIYKVTGNIENDDVSTIQKIAGSLEDKRENQIVFDTTKIATYNIPELKREGKFE